MGMPPREQGRDAVVDVLAQAAQLVVAAAQSDWWDEFKESFFSVIVTEQSAEDYARAVIRFLEHTRRRVTAERPFTQSSKVEAAEINVWERVLRQSPLLHDQDSGRSYLQRINRLLDHFEDRPGVGIILGIDQRVRPTEDTSATAEESLNAATTIDDALTRLFIRLGPPPEPSIHDYAPMGSGDGGVEQ